MDPGIPPLIIKLMLESNPLKSRILVRRLAVSCRPLAKPRRAGRSGTLPIHPRARDHPVPQCLEEAEGHLHPRSSSVAPPSRGRSRLRQGHWLQHTPVSVKKHSSRDEQVLEYIFCSGWHDDLLRAWREASIRLMSPLNSY